MPSARLGTEIEMETSRKKQSNTVARAVKAVYELHCGWWSTEQRGGCLGEHPTPPPGSVAGSPAVHIESTGEGKEKRGSCHSLGFCVSM